MSLFYERACWGKGTAVAQKCPRLHRFLRFLCPRSEYAGAKERLRRRNARDFTDLMRFLCQRSGHAGANIFTIFMPAKRVCWGKGTAAAEKCPRLHRFNAIFMPTKRTCWGKKRLRRRNARGFIDFNEAPPFKGAYL